MRSSTRLSVEPEWPEIACTNPPPGNATQIRTPPRRNGRIEPEAKWLAKHFPVPSLFGKHAKWHTALQKSVSTASWFACCLAHNARSFPVKKHPEQRTAYLSLQRARFPPDRCRRQGHQRNIALIRVNPGKEKLNTGWSRSNNPVALRPRIRRSGVRLLSGAPPFHRFTSLRWNIGSESGTLGKDLQSIGVGFPVVASFFPA